MLRVALDAPEAFLPEWKADALEETKPKGEKLGQRAWWLYQIVASGSRSTGGKRNCRLPPLNCCAGPENRLAGGATARRGITPSCAKKSTVGAGIPRPTPRRNKHSFPCWRED